MVWNEIVPVKTIYTLAAASRLGCCTNNTVTTQISGEITSDIPEIIEKSKYFKIDKVIFNKPATIVFWKDGTKTIVKCQEDDTFDEEKGLAMCFMKKALGNIGRYYENIKKWCKEEIEE